MDCITATQVQNDGNSFILKSQAMASSTETILAARYYLMRRQEDISQVFASTVVFWFRGETNVDSALYFSKAKPWVETHGKRSLLVYYI